MLTEKVQTAKWSAKTVGLRNLKSGFATMVGR
jgi:hypothetical protein